MKNILLLAALLSATVILQAQSVNDEQDMHAFARNFMAAYNAGDHEAIGKMYLDDAVRIDQTGKEIKGADNIAAYFAEQFRNNNATLLLRQQRLGWSDSEHAWVAGGVYEVYGKRYVYDIEIDLAGHYANVMIKDKDKWKIAKSTLTPLTHRDPKVAANITMYADVWDRIINAGRFELFNEDHFMPDVVMHAEPENIVGIEGMAGYYKALTSAFSDIEFTINNIFGEGDQLVKHWTFKGKHTADFFGIPATGNEVVLVGSTIVRMSPHGKIAEERDFMDNMSLLSQLGVLSAEATRK
jgi:predicted ester cyclase/ketosteroid isomerase-like protein